MAGLLFLGVCVFPSVWAAQGVRETVGRIEGDDIVIKDPVSVEVENGRTTAILASGSEVTVRSGQAHLVLEGAELDICGPANFSTLKLNNTVTLALNYGRVHARLAGSVTLVFYTPLVMATPIAIGDSPRDVMLGLDPAGAICILATRGAVRIEQQLTSESLIIPQGGDVQLAGGQLSTVSNAAGSCACESLAVKKESLPRPRPPELSVPAPAPQMRQAKLSEKPEQPATTAVAKEADAPPILTDRPALAGRSGALATEEPVYKVFMPPLTFDAAAPAPPPDPDPQTILLMRTVRVRPSVFYRGHVEPAPVQPAPPVQVALGGGGRTEDSAKAEPGVFARIWAAFRRTFSKKP